MQLKNFYIGRVRYRAEPIKASADVATVKRGWQFNRVLLNSSLDVFSVKWAYLPPVITPAA